MRAEGGRNYSLKEKERKKERNTAAPDLVKSQWLAAIPSHHGERWPGKWGGREGSGEGGSVALAGQPSPARPGALSPWGGHAGAVSANVPQRLHSALFVAAAWRSRPLKPVAEREEARLTMLRANSRPWGKSVPGLLACKGTYGRSELERVSQRP